MSAIGPKRDKVEFWPGTALSTAAAGSSRASGVRRVVAFGRPLLDQSRHHIAATAFAKFFKGTSFHAAWAFFAANVV